MITSDCRLQFDLADRFVYGRLICLRVAADYFRLSRAHFGAHAFKRVVQQFGAFLQHTETPFIVTGSILFATGIGFVIMCILLQKKNLYKFLSDLNRDLYFLSGGEKSSELPNAN